MQDDDKLLLHSHLPKEISDDALDFADYAWTIREILAGLTAESTGLTVGIFGGWGSGKSTVLKMVQALLPGSRSDFRYLLQIWKGFWYRSLGRFTKTGKRFKRMRVRYLRARSQRRIRQALWCYSFGRFTSLERAIGTGKRFKRMRMRHLRARSQRRIRQTLRHHSLRRFTRIGKLLRRLRTHWPINQIRRWKVLWYRSFGRFTRTGKYLKREQARYREPEYAQPAPYQPIVVCFEAWEYSKDEIWIALLRAIRGAVKGQLSFWRLLYLKLRLWWCRIQLKNVVVYVISLWVRIFVVTLVLYGPFLIVRSIVSDAQGGWFGQFITWITSLPGLSAAFPPGANWIEYLGSLLGTTTAAAVLWLIGSHFIKGLWQAIRRIFLLRLSLPPDLVRPSLDTGGPYAVELFRQELRDLIQIVGRRRPIVVLIDDLDRAPIDQITPMLEAIKHFGSELDDQRGKQRKKRRAPIAFVLAADRDAIQQAIVSHYKDFWLAQEKHMEVEHFAREYLEKIVQIFFELPPLSPAALEKLLSMSASTHVTTRSSAAGTHPPGSLAWALQEATPIFTQGPKENPREIIQAYNTFQADWRVIQKRFKTVKEQPTPQLLAALMLIRYIWNEVFDQIYRCPELFFYLHALATNTKNDICSETEIEELLSLGCPHADPLATVERIRRDQPYLMRLLRAVTLPPSLQANGLLRYLILIEDTPYATGAGVPHLHEIDMALMSGDPGLIKFAARYFSSQSIVLRERLPWLIEFLEIGAGTASTSDSPPPSRAHSGSAASANSGQHTEAAMIKALFALGRIGTEMTVEPITRIIFDRACYSTSVAERAVFALAHLASRGLANGIACQALEKIVVDEQAPLGLRVRVLRLLQHISLEMGDIRRAIAHIALYDDMEVMREMSFNLIKKGDWTAVALSELTVAPATPVAFDGFFRIVGNVPEKDVPRFTDEVKEHLVALATDIDSPYQSRAYEVLAKFHDTAAAITYIADVVKNLVASKKDMPRASEPTAEHVTDKARASQESLRRDVVTDAIRRMGELQGAPGTKIAAWQNGAWKEVRKSLKGQSRDYWIAYLQSISLTCHKEAISCLKDVLEEADEKIRVDVEIRKIYYRVYLDLWYALPPDERDLFIEDLQNIARNKDDPQAAAEAQEALKEMEDY